MLDVARSSPSLDDAALLRDYRAGQFSSVAAAVDAALAAGGPVGARSLLLRARVMIKTDAPATLQFLTRQLDDLGPRDRAEATMLIGVAHARANDERLAESTLARAEAMARRLKDPDLVEELQYHVGFLRWTQGRLDEAERAAASLSGARLADVRVRAKILTSLVLSSRGLHREEAAAALEALELALQHDNVELTAFAARNLSTLARELAMPAIRETVRRAVEAIAWTDDLRDLQFKSLKATAWCSALDGDYLSAFRLLKVATKAAPSDHWRVMAGLDRAYLAKCLGEPRWSEQELLEAHELAGQLDWRGVTHEEHVALVLMAELYADLDAAVSLAYLARFREIARSIDRNLSFAHDRRLGAIADYSAGIVHARLGNDDDARESFQAAWDVFDGVHYDWRAGRCAAELYALTGRRVWLERARTKLEGYRTTWLAQGLFDDADGSTVARLTPAQRRVYELLLSGAPTGEIAESLGRSVFTVRNHVKVIFSTFGVNTRAALIADAVKPKRSGA